MSQIDSWITCITFAPKGSCLVNPLEYEVTQQTMDELTVSIADNLNLGDASSERQITSQDIDDVESGSDLDEDEIAENDEDLMAALKMDEYSDEEADETVLDRFIQQSMAGTVYEDDDDEYIQHPDDDDDEDRELDAIDPNHSLILIGNTVPYQNDSWVDLQILDIKSNALYQHHDVKITADPLCLEWLNCNPNPLPNGDIGKGSYVAIGTFTPAIDIWNLDVLHPVEPVATLGGYDLQLYKQKQDEILATTTNKKAIQAKLDKIPVPILSYSHQDGIMSLSWHPSNPQLLLSSSRDRTIKLWNITTRQCLHTYTHHKSEIPWVEWHPTQPHTFLSATDTGHVVVINTSTNEVIREYHVRESYSTPSPSAAAAPSTKKSKVKAKKSRESKTPLETARWNRVNPSIFYVAKSNGEIECYDISNPSPSPVWIIQAHPTTVTCIACNPISESLFVTCGEDRMAKVWDIPDGHEINHATVVPTMLAQRDLAVGRLFSIAFDPSTYFTVASGGDGGALAVWDLLENIHINKRYKDVAEQQLGLGDQTLPEHHVQLQLQGLQSKGIGPGANYRQFEKDDYDSDDDNDDDDEGVSRMTLDHGGDEDDSNDDNDDDSEDEMDD